MAHRHRIRPFVAAGGVAVLAAATLAGARPAAAHPHVWIDARASLVMADGLLQGIAVEWTLDAFVSALLIEDFDGDGDGAFSTHEAAALHDQTFSGLSEYGYYTHLTVDGIDIGPAEIRDFAPAIAGDAVVYRFFAPLPIPADPTRKRVEVAFYDETYYVDVALVEPGIALAGAEGLGCTLEGREDLETPLYYGLAFPYRTAIVCAAG
ncbi:MAG: DUF1007 family protein [Inquilinus sp.]|nr:DUF1007 family protein [Inquilinus sp.]